MSMTWCGWRRARYWRLSSWSCGPAEHLHLHCRIIEIKNTWRRELVVVVVVGVLEMLWKGSGGQGLHGAGEQLHSFSPQGSREPDATQNKQISRLTHAPFDRELHAIGILLQNVVRVVSFVVTSVNAKQIDCVLF